MTEFSSPFAQRVVALLKAPDGLACLASIPMYPQKLAGHGIIARLQVRRRASPRVASRRHASPRAATRTSSRPR
jgi:hypothetical protein